MTLIPSFDIVKFRWHGAMCMRISPRKGVSCSVFRTTARDRHEPTGLVDIEGEHVHEVDGLGVDGVKSSRTGQN